MSQKSPVKFRQEASRSGLFLVASIRIETSYKGGYECFVADPVDHRKGRRRIQEAQLRRRLAQMVANKILDNDWEDSLG